MADEHEILRLHPAHLLDDDNDSIDQKEQQEKQQRMKNNKKGREILLWSLIFNPLVGFDEISYPKDNNVHNDNDEDTMIVTTMKSRNKVVTSSLSSSTVAATTDAAACPENLMLEETWSDSTLETEVSNDEGQEKEDRMFLEKGNMEEEVQYGQIYTTTLRDIFISLDEHQYEHSNGVVGCGNSEHQHRNSSSSDDDVTRAAMVRFNRIVTVLTIPPRCPEIVYSFGSQSGDLPIKKKKQSWLAKLIRKQVLAMR